MSTVEIGSLRRRRGTAVMSSGWHAASGLVRRTPVDTKTLDNPQLSNVLAMWDEELVNAAWNQHSVAGAGERVSPDSPLPAADPAEGAADDDLVIQVDWVGDGRPQSSIWRASPSDTHWALTPFTALLVGSGAHASLKLSRLLSADEIRRLGEAFISSSAEQPDSSGVPEELTGEAADAIAAVEWLQTALGVPRRDVLKAANIKERTWHHWQKTPGAHPRLSSQGELWSLMQQVQILLEELDEPPANWFRRNTHLRKLLQAGKIDQIVDSLFDEKLRSNAFDDPITARRRRARAASPEYHHHDEDVDIRGGDDGRRRR